MKNVLGRPDVSAFILSERPVFFLVATRCGHSRDNALSFRRVLNHILQRVKARSLSRRSRRQEVTRTITHLTQRQNLCERCDLPISEL